MTALARRTCGACNACCVELKIAAPDLRKKAGVTCRHLVDKGCGIYKDRPEVCRTFLCGWRIYEELDDNWRPDKSGVLITVHGPADLPASWAAAPYGIRLVVTGGDAAVARPAFAAYVARLMKQNIPVYMAAASPAILVNEHLSPGEMEDPKLVSEMLRLLHAMLREARWERGLLKIIVPLYRLQVARVRRRMMTKS